MRMVFIAREERRCVPLYMVGVFLLLALRLISLNLFLQRSVLRVFLLRKPGRRGCDPPTCIWWWLNVKSDDFLV